MRLVNEKFNINKQPFFFFFERRQINLIKLKYIIMNKELKERHLKEIKSLEQQYKRNLIKQEDLQEVQSDISSRIQIILNKL